MKLGSLAAFLALANPGRARNQLTNGGKSKDLEGNFVHIVFFWLKDDDKKTKNKFFKELKKFIDNSYSYCLVLSFDSKKEHDIYQEHQLHKDFIANASSLWKKVIVYDSVKS